MEFPFGAWLKKRRRALDLTQDDLAKRAHCSVNSLRKIESGALIPSKTLALEIARALALPDAAHADFVRFARTPSATASENSFLESRRAVSVEQVSASSASSGIEKFQPPAPLTAALGRERDSNVICQTLRLPAVRLVTLTGPPGTGKTRQSLEVANELQQEFRHGAAFVPLAPVSDSARVAAAIALVLDVRDEHPDRALAKFLSNKQLLLVLDNFEHVLDAAPLVADLLRAAPQLQVLATSREPLNVYGERRMPVAPLGVPPLTPLPPLVELENFPAVQLFVERAQEVSAGFELTPANAPAVARVCVELEGLPLAIEMAAARVKWETPEQMLPGLGQRLETLSSGRRFRDARQHTLRGALDWSYALLDETEQRVLRHLGVFRGGFTADAAEAVCAIPIRTYLERLVEKSLVKAERGKEDALRYALLEFIREYAREKLEPNAGAELPGGAGATGELDTAQARHYQYFVTLAGCAEPHMNDQMQIEWKARLEVEHDNLRSALSWALVQPDANRALRLAGSLHLFWLDRNHAGEGLGWYEQALAKSDARCEPLFLAKAYSGAGSMAWALGNPNKASSLHAQALHYFEEARDPEGIAFSLHNLAVQETSMGQLDRAEALAHKALAMARAANVAWVTSQILNELGTIASFRGSDDRTADYYQESLELARTGHDSIQISVVLHNLGCVESRRGNFQRAAALLDESLQMAQELRENRIVVGTYGEQGLLFIRRGEPASAVPVCLRGAQLAFEYSFQELYAFNLEWLAVACAYLQQFEQAVRLWGAAMVRRQESGVPLGSQYRAEYERAVGYTREHMEEDRFAELLAQGQGMSPGQVWLRAAPGGWAERPA